MTGCSQHLPVTLHEGAGVTGTTSSLSNTLLGEMAKNQLLTAQIRAAETSQIANEEYLDDTNTITPINTITPGPSNRAGDDEIVAVERNFDNETRPQVRLSKSAGKKPVSHRSNSRHNGHRSHQAQQREDERLAMRSAQSLRKVSEWFTRNESYGDY